MSGRTQEMIHLQSVPIPSTFPHPSHDLPNYAPKFEHSILNYTSCGYGSLGALGVTLRYGYTVETLSQGQANRPNSHKTCPRIPMRSQNVLLSRQQYKFSEFSFVQQASRKPRADRSRQDQITT